MPAPYILLTCNSYFSSQALQTLYSAGYPPCMIALPGNRSSLIPVRQRSANRTDITSLAFQYRIPLLDLPDQEPESWPGLLSISAKSCLLSICFPQRIPASLWATAICFNLHPSLLPAYRGPTPLFWQFQRGEHQTGVTLHCVNSVFDDGDIVLTQALALKCGVTLRQTESRLAVLGAGLFMSMLQRWRPPQPLVCQTQDRSRITYYPAPGPRDYVIDADWTMDRALRFINGLADNHLYFQYQGRHHRYRFRNISKPRTETRINPLPKKTVLVQLADGQVLLLDVQFLPPKP